MFLSFRLRLMESALDAMDRAAGRRPSRRAPHLAIGVRGERAAYFWLRRQGYTVVAHSWRSGRARGDLDLVAWTRDLKTLCFIEVKTRTTRAVAAAHVAVDEDKRRTLRRLAWHYLRQLPSRDVARRDLPVRFDILSIYFEKGKPAIFEHFPGAFGWTESAR